MRANAQPQQDAAWMRKALALARRAWGRTSPNPLVGAVVVRDGDLVGSGYHQAAGTPHAEIHALADAGGLARDATLYVTLEPCCTTGRTPPCTDAIIDAGITAVVVGCLDPNPQHSGRGIAVLEAAGITVRPGVLEETCTTLNEAFFWWIQRRQPFVLLKMAMTLDGKIATADGDSKWVTGPAARRHVQRLRQWADAIMVGAETVRRDDPLLNVRSPRNWPRQPQRLVWSRQAALPPDSALARDQVSPVQLVNPISADDWQLLLGGLGRQGITALLIEGGGELAAAAINARIVNKIAFFVAPKILGGRGSRPVVGGPDPAALNDALRLDGFQSRRVGDDLLITGYCMKSIKTG